MKTNIHNSAHKHIRIPEHTYIIHYVSQSYGWQNISLIGPRLNKIFNHLIHCIMKQKTKVSETVPAGEVAVENVILLNYSNSKKMSTTKKVSSKMLVLFAAFLMAVGVGKAQEQTVKSADATEVVSAGKEVKPAIVVPEKLGKAMKGAIGEKRGKVNLDKINGKLVQTTGWYQVSFTGLPHSSPSNQQIQNVTISELGTDCQTTFSGDICAIRINNPDNVSFSLPIMVNSLPAGVTVTYAKARTEEDGIKK